jgi:hypothetical protein
MVHTNSLQLSQEALSWARWSHSTPSNLLHTVVPKNVFLRQQTVVAVGRKIISVRGSVEIYRLNSMQQSPSSEANSYFLGHILWNPKVQYPTPNSLALLPLLSHTIRYYFFKTIFNIILPATRTYSSGPFFFQMSPPKLCGISLLPYTCHMHRPCHPPRIWSE